MSTAAFPSIGPQRLLAMRRRGPDGSASVRCLPGPTKTWPNQRCVPRQKIAPHESWSGLRTHAFVINTSWQWWITASPAFPQSVPPPSSVPPPTHVPTFTPPAAAPAPTQQVTPSTLAAAGTRRAVTLSRRNFIGPDRFQVECKTSFDAFWRDS